MLRFEVTKDIARAVIRNFEANPSPALPKELESLHRMLATIRKLEATNQGCSESEVAVVLCVDKLMKIEQHDSRECLILLNAIVCQQQMELARDGFSFPL